MREWMKGGLRPYHASRIILMSDQPMGTSSPALETHHLRKTFGDKPAVSDLSLTVERGEVFGFLGPNGAGKTTSVKMLLNLVFPTSGEASLLAGRLNDPQVR